MSSCGYRGKGWRSDAWMSLTFMQWKLQTFHPREDLASWLVFRYFGLKVRAQCNSHNRRNSLGHLPCWWGVSERKSFILHELPVGHSFLLSGVHGTFHFLTAVNENHITHIQSPLHLPNEHLLYGTWPLRGSGGIDILKWTTWTAFFILGYETSQRWPTII